MTKKQKLCIGFLSFEEADIALDIEQKIIMVRSSVYL